MQTQNSFSKQNADFENMLITQTSAIEQVRKATGLSWDASRNAVSGLETYTDGRRHKVYGDHVEKLIAQLRRPPVAERDLKGVKGLSERHRQAAQVARECRRDR